jgi:hypothetical protein
LQSITRHHRDTPSRKRDRLAPSEVFRPFSVFGASRSHIPPAGSQPVRLRCVLRVSLPLDALLPMTPPGLISSRSRSWGSPFEVFLRPPCRTSFSDAESLMGFRRILRISAAPPGVFHTASSTPAGLGFNQVPRVDCLLGFLPSEVSRLRSWRLATLLPSRAFPSRPSFRPGRRRPRVYRLRRLGASLSRSTSPHRLLHLASVGPIYVPNERVW